jgi:hypothetical protein
LPQDKQNLLVGWFVAPHRVHTFMWKTPELELCRAPARDVTLGSIPGSLAFYAAKGNAQARGTNATQPTHGLVG